jgi:hypothetical protein
MRALVAGYYIAMALKRQLVVVWPEMKALHAHSASRESPTTFSLSDNVPPTKSCLVIDCVQKAFECKKDFTSKALTQLFPPEAGCIVLATFSPLDKYLLDNPRSYAQMAVLRHAYPPSEIFHSFLCTVDQSLRSSFCAWRAKLRAADVSFSVHIRTGVDKADGGRVINMYAPQLRCLARLQLHFKQQNLSTISFIESDYDRLKDSSMLWNKFHVSSVLFLPTHAERSNLRETMIFWLLLGEGDVAISNYWSSLGITAAERAGGAAVYALPNDRRHMFMVGPDEASQECKQNLASTATHDLTHILVPTECAVILPSNCNLIQPFQT